MRHQSEQAAEFQRSILAALGEGELAAGQIAKKLNCHAPTLSYHLEQMLRLGAIAVTVRGSRRIYRLASQPTSAGPVEAARGIRVFFVTKWSAVVPEREPDLVAADHAELVRLFEHNGFPADKLALLRSVARSLETLEPSRTSADALIQLDAGLFKIVLKGGHAS